MISVFNLEAEEDLTKDVATLPAYGLYLRAANYKYGKECFEEAITLLERAVELDPNFYEAHSLPAWRQYQKCQISQGSDSMDLN